MDKQKYLVRHGRRFGKDKQLSAGDVVELTTAEYVGLEDVLELAPAPAPAPKEAAPKEPTPNDAAPKEPAPNDAGLSGLTVAELTEIAKEYEIATNGLRKDELIAAIEDARKPKE